MATESVPFTLVEHHHRKAGTIARFPFVCGRLPGNDLVLTHPYVSRRHAQIVRENDLYYIADLGSRHGTFLNGAKIAAPQRLREGDTLAFGTMEGPVLHFGVSNTTSTSTVRDIIDQISVVGASSTALEKLRWFFEAARKLSGEGSIEQILAALLETTLQLAQVERGFVFLRDPSGGLTLAMGRDAQGEPLLDDATVSHGAIHEALTTAKEFIVTDTFSAEQRSESIVAHSIRSIICIPLRKHRIGASGRESEMLGLLYLDSRLKPGTLSQVDSDLLRTIATDAAALLDNTQLALAEENERRYREELNLAAQIQDNLMSVQLPSLAFATVAARSIPCREIGGDFFLAVPHDDSLSVAVADVSGKGISAAILACTLQGMLYSQLVARQPLAVIADMVNRYICDRNIRKYATMAILRLDAGGELEYINCGHIPPFLCSDDSPVRLLESNLPVGLIEQASFQAGAARLRPGARILIVTDGVTEAHAGNGEFFGEQRVAQAALGCASLDELFTQVQRYCGSKDNDDDCTILEVRYTG
jgi:phosphoserine phosphatase RsbU/P